MGESGREWGRVGESGCRSTSCPTSEPDPSDPSLGADEEAFVSICVYTDVSQGSGHGGGWYELTHGVRCGRRHGWTRSRVDGVRVDEVMCGRGHVVTRVRVDEGLCRQGF